MKAKVYKKSKCYSRHERDLNATINIIFKSSNIYEMIRAIYLANKIEWRQKVLVYRGFYEVEKACCEVN